MKIKSLLLAAALCVAPFHFACAQIKPSAQRTPHGAVLINENTRNQSQSAESVQIAQSGKALLPIVISAQATEASKATANEFAEIMERITGAKFEIQTGDGARGLVVGTIAEFPQPGLEKALEMRMYDGVEAFAIRTSKDRVLLLGNTDLGADHAVFRFLREIGYRHFFPHKAWEVVPKIPDLKWNQNITDRPSVLSRNIWFEAGSGTPTAEKAYRDWKRHNFQTESFVVNAGHALYAVVSANKAEFDAHPEYYALVKQADGSFKRDPAGGQLEYSNPRVRELIVKYAVDYFKQHPEQDMVSIEPNDTNNYSQSPEALKMGSISNQIYGIANEAARALQKAYPGQNKMVGLLSYNSTFDPPDFELEPNVHVQVSSMGVNPKYSQEERWEIWPKRSKSLGRYEYYSVWMWNNDALIGGFVNNPRSQQKYIREDYIGKNVVSLSGESTSSWGSLGRGYYMTSLLLWNPDIDVESALNDFYDKAFGPAAAPMKRYYESLDPINHPLLSAHLLGVLLRDVDEATKLAKDRPDVIERINQIKLYLRYVTLRWERDMEGAQVGDEILRNLYRTRELALTSWELIRQVWGGNKYPGQPDAPAWMTGEPYTQEEIDKDFQEELKHFVPRIRTDLQPVQTFSDDVLPVEFDQVPVADKIDNHQAYQGDMYYVLWSLKGEPLEFTTKASDAWGYKTKWEVLDSKGKVINKGDAPPKEEIEHHIEVPAPGKYILHYIDPGAFWEFKAAPDKVATMIARPDKTSNTGGIYNDWYFYVPKGTKVIEYFMEGGGPHVIYAPDGSMQRLVTQAQINDYISIPVPPGMDGRLWRFNQARYGKFHLSNIPPYFSGSPYGLVLPREVIEKDGLKVRR